MYLERKGKENNSSNLRTGSTVKQLFSILTEKGGGRGGEPRKRSAIQQRRYLA